jgi:hypothetical protein
VSRYAVSWGLGIVGAAAGGVLGYFAFVWLLEQGFYGMMLPGGFLGIGCGLLSRHDSTARGALCGLAGLALGLFAEWQNVFLQDYSFPSFLQNLHQLPKWSMVMIIGGGLLAFWFGRGQFRMTRDAPRS